MLLIKLKPIFNGFLAKQLLHRGNAIVDLQKNHKLKNATVFYFEETEKFINDLKELTAEESAVFLYSLKIQRKDKVIEWEILIVENQKEYQN